MTSRKPLLRPLLQGRPLQLASKTLGFSIAPALSVLTPIFVLPIISRVKGVDGLYAVLLGQSVGAAVGTLVALHWPLDGPTLAARSSEEKRTALYQDSLASRIVAFSVCGPAAALACTVVVDRYLEVAIATSLAFASYGFTSSWYYIGIGSPRGFIIYEVLYRVSSAFVSGIVILAGGPLLLYPLSLLLAAVLGILHNLRAVTGSYKVHIDTASISLIWSKREETLSRFVNGLYQAGSTSIVAFSSGAAALAFSYYDRTQKSALNASLSLPQAIAGWASKSGALGQKRQKIAVLCDVLLCIVIISVALLALPLVLKFLFGTLAPLSNELIIPAAVGIGLAVFSKALIMHAMVPAGHSRFVARILSSLSLIAVPSLFLAGRTGGASAALWIVASTEGLLSVIFVLRAIVGWRNHE